MEHKFIMANSKQIYAFIVSAAGFTISEIEMFIGWTEFAIKVVTLATAMVAFYQVIKKNKAMKYKYQPGGDDTEGSAGEEEENPGQGG